MKNFCSIIGKNISDESMEHALEFLSKKTGNDNLDLLYCVLEEDLGLFLEMFGGEILRVPSKREILNAVTHTQVFDYIKKNINRDDILQITASKFKGKVPRIRHIISNVLRYAKIDLDESTIARLKEISECTEYDDFRPNTRSRRKKEKLESCEHDDENSSVDDDIEEEIQCEEDGAPNPSELKDEDYGAYQGIDEDDDLNSDGCCCYYHEAKYEKKKDSGELENSSAEEYLGEIVELDNSSSPATTMASQINLPF